MHKRIERKDIVLNKIKRFSIVIFLKKILPFVLFLIILLLSLLLGFWDVKKFEYVNSDFKYVNEQELDTYLSAFVDVNIFLLNPDSVGDLLKSESGYIKRVNVKKILPNKLSISFEEYVPFYSGYSMDKCVLFSSEGTKIVDICQECEEECKELSSEYSQVYITSNAVLESSKRLIFFEEVSSIEKVLSLFGYSVVEIAIQDGIAVFKDSEQRTYVFDIAYNLDIQLSRLYLVCKKIDSDMIQYKSIDLRFARPVMKLK